VTSIESPERARAPIEREDWPLDNETPVLLPPPTDPMAVARELVKSAITHVQGLPIWTWWRGDFYQWAKTHWAILPEPTIEQWAYTATEDALYQGVDRKGKPIAERWSPTTVKVRNLIHALGRGVIQRDHSLEAEDEPNAIACANGVLTIGQDRLGIHTPARFNLFALPFAYDAQAVCPRWLLFLSEVLPGEDEQDAVLFIQEWFGYVVSGRTDLHKIASFIGDKRCGKGTIARVLVGLVGANFVTGPQLGDLAGTFGKEPLIGKRLAVMGDVRWNSKSATDAVPILLGISGDDHGTVHRKNQKAWEGRLGVRFLLMSNDEPRFTDASGAMASRMIHVDFQQSFFGRENPGLTGELLSELPGILNWALEGLARLNRNGRFTVPKSSARVDEHVQRTASPAKAFIEDKCVIEADAKVSLGDLFVAWQEWCRHTGRPELMASEDMLSAQLRSAVRGSNPKVVTKRQMVRGVRTTWFFNLRLRTALDDENADGEPVADTPGNQWLIGGGGW